MSWLPISEAPKDGTRVLLFSPDAIPELAVWVGEWICDEDQPDGGAWWQDVDDPFPVDADPTHWMHLPAPPSKVFDA